MIKRRDLPVRLSCCGAEHRVQINEEGIRGGEPNEVRRNVICPACGEIVILSFNPSNPDHITDQEVVKSRRS